MKNLKSVFLTACLSVTALIAQAQDIKLPAPNLKKTTKSVMQTLATRHSVRQFSNKELSKQDISDLCWAACGTTRGGQFRTAPTARNKQEIRLYVLTAQAAYEYDAQANTLKEIAKDDHRALLANNGTQGKGINQDFVNQAPVCLVMVIDLDLLGGNSQQTLMMGCVDAGNVSENVNLYCEAAGLVTVPRATMDVKGLRQLLKLNERQIPIMNNPVGY